MAVTKDLKIRYLADADQLKRGVREVDKANTGLKSKLGSVGGAIAKVGALIGVAYGAKAVVDFGMSAVHAAEDAAAANRKSLALISSDADKTFVHFDKLTQWSTDFGNGIGQDDEAITSLASKVASSFDLKKLFGAAGATTGLETITKTIVNMSAALDKPQKMVQKLFNTLANDPKAGISQLLKLGVISEKQAGHFTNLVKSGHGVQVSQELMALASKKYEGAAAAGATVSAKLGAVWDNLKETLGAFLLPLFTKAVTWISKMVEWVTNLLNGNRKLSGHMKSQLAPIIQTVTGYFQAGKDIVLTLADVVRTKLWPAIQKLAEGPLGKLVIVLVKVDLFLTKLIWKVIPPFIRIVGALLGTIASIINGVASLIGHILNGIIHGLNAVIHGINLVKPGADIATIPTIDLSNSGGGGPSLTEERVQTRAAGGRMARRGWALVGERGPELLRLPGGSEVFPNGTGLGGGGNVTVYVAGSVTTERELAQTIRRQLILANRANSGGIGLA